MHNCDRPLLEVPPQNITGLRHRLMPPKKRNDPPREESINAKVAKLSAFALCTGVSLVVPLLERCGGRSMKCAHTGSSDSHGTTHFIRHRPMAGGNREPRSSRIEGADMQRAAGAEATAHEPQKLPVKPQKKKKDRNSRGYGAWEGFRAHIPRFARQGNRRRPRRGSGL